MARRAICSTRRTTDAPDSMHRNLAIAGALCAAFLAVTSSANADVQLAIENNGDTVSLQGNISSTAHESILARSVAEYYNWDHLQPTIHERYTAEIPTMEEYQGRFDNNSVMLTFTLNEGHLQLTSETDESPQQLIPIGNSKFISTDRSVMYQFYRPRNDKDGAIKWVRITQPSGNDTWCERVM